MARANTWSENDMPLVYHGSVSVAEHKAASPAHVRVFWITVSDTRTPQTDSGGQKGRELLEAAGHHVAGYRIVPDEASIVSRLVRTVARDEVADVLITSGGTGITSRDATYEAIHDLLDKRIDGFGEIFRALSFHEIGAAAMMSRAVAGLHGKLVVFSIPGSTAAVHLALEKLIVPELGHVVREARR
jgi:molybdenum cofactor biosynthesis protein B